MMCNDVVVFVDDGNARNVFIGDVGRIHARFGEVMLFVMMYLDLDYHHYHHQIINGDHILIHLLHLKYILVIWFNIILKPL